MTVLINGRYSHNYIDGVLVKEALNPANETVNRGHYAATTLSAVDADLATANIKNGITMFGFAGSADVFDISDATAIEAEVIAGETFYAVGGGIRTGTMPIVALNPAANAYPTGYHAGAASLTAVDGDLVAANIADGITIFGVLGTLVAGALAEDLVDSAQSAIGADVADVEYEWHKEYTSDAEYDLATITKTYDADSMAVGVAQVAGRRSGTVNTTLRLYMDGVLIAESANLVNSQTRNYCEIGTRALSGSKICKTSIDLAPGTGEWWVGGAFSAAPIHSSISVGSIKLV